MKRELKFRDDGTFVIVQFSDVEFIDEHDYDPESPELDQVTRTTMERIIREEQPDLVVFAGDLIASARTKDPIQSFREAVAVVEQSQVPWAAVFGNHDSEGSVTRKQMHAAQLEHEFCVAEEDPPGLSGAGNFVLKVLNRDNEAGAALYLLDSGDYPPEGSAVGGYDWIHRDQIEWYASQSRALTKQNGGNPLPALAFFHIPLPEYNEVWDNHVCYGHRLDGYCASPQVNSGFFTAMLEMGDVMGTFVGHDHANDFHGTLHGIRLCYGRATKYVSYVDGVRNDYFPTGARVIKLQAGERKFDTWIRQNDGTVVKEQPEHQPEGCKI
ncbi:metallophosphoesterase family protein [Paenibacillus mendelii]|uniref:Metallophosphoesterase family protein n=1 Tax=Paenibacillus mendelii TaxID=206163 RepID=A0ABV6J843_9BACL|nr:metallophosphoesterase family protein [Paenibacillus mendelii]MCQ6561332.1 metallophosphoesterase family protein [Paenibacillus mendelii]